MAEDDIEEEVSEEDVFGLPKLSTNAEVAISFTLFVLGNLLLFSVLYTAGMLNAMTTFSLLLLAAAYLFAIEAIRELEEKDHFLSAKLMGE
jgi:hypothetical protein